MPKQSSSGSKKVSRSAAKHPVSSKIARGKAPVKTGRPSLYEPGYNHAAYTACLAGATDMLLAEQFGVNVSTIYEWKREFPEFAESIKRGKHPANNAIASALFERAKGAVWIEEQAIKCKRVEYKEGKRVLEVEHVEIVHVTRRAPPDTTAGIFWLKNRRPDAWRDKHEHEFTDVSTLSDEELEKRRKALGLA